MAHWSDDSLCRGMHSEMWYPPLFKEERTAPEAQYYDLGKLVCEHCPVINECHEAGQDEEYGMWGGQTPKERRNNVYRKTKTYLPLDKLSVMPLADTEVPLFIPELRMDIRKHLKRRPRNKT
jgi:hypothetical protein